MNVRRRVAAVAIAATGVAVSVAGSLPAQAAAPAPWRVSAHVKTDTVKSGKDFVVAGRYVYLDKLVEGGHVRVQAWRSDHWENLKGAKVKTDANGHYRIHLSLSSGGARKLCVLAWQDGEQGVAVKNFSVDVEQS